MKSANIKICNKANGNNQLFILLISLITVLFIACSNDNTEDDYNWPENPSKKPPDILEKIQDLGVASVTEIQSLISYERLYRIDISQPVDHNNPDGARFNQRVYLEHIGEDMPMVLAPSGYCANATTREIAGILHANCLIVTHRYFCESKPDPLDWQHLTIKQSADDHHQIVSLFKQIYKNVWISSGASKGGMAALYHRRYYPDDVDATITYCTPFSFGINDQRYPEYLRNIGDSECFPKLMQIQQYVLSHKNEILPLIDNYIAVRGSTYSMDRELILENTTVAYPFIFWQIHNYDCSSIPDTTTSSTEEIFRHFTNVASIESYSDENSEYLEPYRFQAVTELGTPALQTDYLSSLLTKYDPDDPENEFDGQRYTFNATTIPDIYQWLQTQGDRIIYIYGENDPWSAGAIELDESVDAVFIMQQGANHNINLYRLDDPDIVYDALERWLGIQINKAVNTPAMIVERQYTDEHKSEYCPIECQ